MIKPEDYKVLFLDMNSFFASVEQQVQPTLRGIPLGVAPYTGESGCIISASREAKKFGIKVSRVKEAKRIIPDLKIIEARPALYMIYHKEIRKVIESVTPYYDPLSIDEFALNLTKSEQNEKTATALAFKLKKEIRERVGDYLSCSIGIGPNKFLAKTAGERKKPDGLTIVELKNLAKFYTNLNLTDLPGINWRLARRLKNFGIDSPLSLYNSSLGGLAKILKHWGKLWYFRLRGYEIDNFEVKNKTIGHSHVLEPEFRTSSGALTVLKKLFSKVAYRLRKEDYLATGLAISIDGLSGENFKKSKRFMPVSDSLSLISIAKKMTESFNLEKPILVSVSSFGLVKNRQEMPSLFADMEKAKRLGESNDNLNAAFGSDCIAPASVWQAGKSAPDRIPFGRSRYEIIH